MKMMKKIWKKCSLWCAPIRVYSGELKCLALIVKSDNVYCYYRKLRRDATSETIGSCTAMRRAH
jgi:hypothetical protein